MREQIFYIFVYFTLYAPSAGHLWTKFIALPTGLVGKALNSVYLLVYFIIEFPSTGIKPEITFYFLPHWVKLPLLQWLLRYKLRIGIEYKYYREIEDGKGDVHFLGNRTRDFAQLI